jgi:hypothetical protein
VKQITRRSIRYSRSFRLRDSNPETQPLLQFTIFSEPLQQRQLQQAGGFSIGPTLAGGAVARAADCCASSRDLLILANDIGNWAKHLNRLN